jgi:hypothetical protein
MLTTRRTYRTLINASTVERLGIPETYLSASPDLIGFSVVPHREG